MQDTDISMGRVGLYCWGNHDAQYSQVFVFPAAVAFTDWVIDDPFERLSSRWAFVDRGSEDGPSQWTVSGGQLRQTSSIRAGTRYGGSPVAAGTHALLSEVEASDFRLTVQLASDARGALGILFRHRDSENYYCLAVSEAPSYRRLTKTVAGKVDVLWEDQSSYVIRQEHLLTVDCIGQRLIGFFDGVQLFAVSDGDLSSD